MRREERRRREKKEENKWLTLARRNNNMEFTQREVSQRQHSLAGLVPCCVDARSRHERARREPKAGSVSENRCAKRKLRPTYFAFAQPLRCTPPLESVLGHFFCLFFLSFNIRSVYRRRRIRSCSLRKENRRDLDCSRLNWNLCRQFSSRNDSKVSKQSTRVQETIASISNLCNT